MTMLEIQPLAQLVAERALNSIAGGLLIAAFAWMVLRVVGRQNSGTRFAVWFSALLAIAGLPFVPSVVHPTRMAHVMGAEITLPMFWGIAIFAIWIFFATFSAARMVAGLWNLRRLRRSAVEIESSSLDPLVRETLAQCQAIRPVTLCGSAMVSVPTAIGFLNPVILIPEWALRELPPEEQKIILLHEFTHLRRWDDWTNLAQKILRTIFFFHPAVWWIEKRLSLEREMACDDAVLAQTANPRAYAECLVSLAEKSFMQRGLALAHAAISRACETSIRLAQILDVDRPRATRVFKPALGLMTVLAGASLVVLPDAPKLIAFEQPYRLAATEKLPRTIKVPAIPVIARTAVDDSRETGVPRVVATPAVYRPPRPLSLKHKFDHNVSHSLASKRDRYQLPVIAPVAAIQKTQAPQFLLVMQMTEFDQHGSRMLSVSVWRVIVVQPHGNRVPTEVVAKSI